MEDKAFPECKDKDNKVACEISAHCDWKKQDKDDEEPKTDGKGKEGKGKLNSSLLEFEHAPAQKPKKKGFGFGGMMTGAFDGMKKTFGFGKKPPFGMKEDDDELGECVPKGPEA